MKRSRQPGQPVSKKAQAGVIVLLGVTAILSLSALMLAISYDQAVAMLQRFMPAPTYQSGP